MKDCTSLANCIEDVRVDLTWAGPDNKFGTDDDQEWTTKTNKDGKYEFTNLPPGNYKVDVDLGDSDLKGYTIKCDGDHNDENPNGIDQVTIEQGENYKDADFGFIKDTDELEETLAETGTNMPLYVLGGLALGGIIFFLRKKGDGSN